MSKDIVPFDFNGSDIRVVMRDGEPWFVAKDVCEVLGLSNVGEAVASLDDDEKSKISNSDLGRPGGHDSPIVNEPGLYSLILRSRKPEAKAFKRWVTHEVLPSIRTKGFYGIPKTFAEALRLAADEAERREIAEARVQRLTHDDRTYTTTEIAKELGYRSAQALHDELHQRGIIYKDGRGVWLLYSQYAERGFQRIKQKEINGKPRYYSEWTGVGREWLIGVIVDGDA